MIGTCAVFVGDGSLLIQCAEVYRRAGHRLVAVASHAEAVLAWAAQKNIRAIRLKACAPLALADVSGLEFDYLFSIASLQMLPASVMARARKLALNFHDSLLPRYAGLHAPSWTLMAQEAAHGITWHEITPAVDAGRIVRQVRLDIAPDETAVSLNTKCYDAGLSSFAAIVQDLGRGELPLTAQSGTRSYFGVRKRPDWLATLDFSRPARELEALVRALDFGPYPNALVCPKIYLGGKVLYVRSAHAIPALSQALPGTVLGVQGDTLRIATGEGDLLLDGIHDAAGPVVARELAQGALLPALGDALRGRLASAMLGAAQGESFWRKAFAGLAALELPYPRKVAPPGPVACQPVRLPLDVPACASQSVAGFFSWLSALTGQQTISALYCDDTLATQAEGIEPWLCPWVPLTLTLDAQASARQAQALVSVHIQAMRQAGPYLCDLPLRLGAKLAASVPPLHIGVSMSRRAKPGKADLLLTVDVTGDKLELIADSAVFTPETMHTMVAHLAAYLQAFGDASGGSGGASCCVAAIALQPEAEAQSLAQLNAATATPYDEALCVHQAVSAQAARTPEHVALSAQGRSLSYRELDAAATALARRLVAHGVRPGDTVGICLEREAELVVSVLAVLKTGAAYLPLDPAYPHDRILYMIEDSAAATVITTRAVAAALNMPADKAFWLDGPASLAAAADLPQVSADSAAYMIYTSGSTGRPKGVVVLHRNAINFFAGMTERVPADPAGRWLAVTSLSFDISVLELLWTLTRGLSVVLYSATAKARSNLTPPSIADEIVQNCITHLQCTPSMASMLVADTAGRAALGRLDVLMVGGEALSLPLARQLRELLPGKFLNMYGPTETTVWSTTCDLAQIGDFIALGEPIANTRLHIRTPGGLECPALVAGELLIGGAGVTRGYWQRPELTAERFVPDPAQPGDRLYRTGDLVRRHPNGQLEFLGRIDHQVKLRGHRIELGEIESALQRQPGVKEAVVIVHEDAMGDKRLVGYLTPKIGEAPDTERIHAALKSDLPEVMVPTVLLVLPALPLTPNNKVDRRALPPPRAAASAVAAPESLLEKRIAAIWQEALGVDTVSATDNFFDIGGHSLLVVQVQRRLRQACGHEVSITDLFRLPTVRALAARLERCAVVKVTADAALNPVERAIADVWCDLLWVEKVERDDDFFALGGHSLAAVRLFSWLHKQFGVDLPLATLFQAPTLGALAALVTATVPASVLQSAPSTPVADVSSGAAVPPARQAWSPLVMICRGAPGRRPLFLVHGAGGNVLIFKTLSDLLGPDQPVYGLQAQGVDGKLPVQTRIDAMAAQYVEAVRSVEPDGPYRLGGFSGGGVIAFEMAQQLTRAGQRIALLGMIDTLSPTAAQRPLSWYMRLRLSWALKFGKNRKNRAELRRLGLREAVLTAQVRERLAHGEPLPPELVEFHLWNSYGQAQSRYHAQLYVGSVLLFRAAESLGHYLAAGKRLGWEEFVQGEIRITTVDGNHLAVMVMPGVAKVAEGFRRELALLDEAKEAQLGNRAIAFSAEPERPRAILLNR